MAKTGKKKAASRVRYEYGHPTVSCRVSRDVYDMLRAVMDVEGKSFADILKIGLGIVKLAADKEEKAFSEGYNYGYSQAEQQFKVTYHCSVCSKTIELASEAEKEAASKYMQEHCWGHKECHERQRKNA